ncbi:ferredoxin-thioredoxin reductase catalytic chain, chloroplastic [Iris pallida]|uniref:Ferredoxin-thioredoxin reductase catalytic chain, chloroplastic n=2 Tax=Magnoliopsida TaxID=3398 RepID=A0AAX6IC91_IRIPA|nr:ferredoxin-thioredoxin reductase catalytic chain, chloroplastic [Iris pallida]
MSIHSSFSGVGLPCLSPAPTARRSRCRVSAKAEPSEKSVELMRKFSEQYARRSGTYFCVDKGVTSVVIKGLADHKDSVGAPLCPCRHYDDKAAEVGQGFWNCPCVPMRERKECHCMLFLTPDNDFAGADQAHHQLGRDQRSNIKSVTAICISSYSFCMSRIKSWCFICR